ncbi:hypothetical protein LINGRAHAP2_LOCUS2394 [Linum grandiflorum]
MTMVGPKLVRPSSVRPFLNRFGTFLKPVPQFSVTTSQSLNFCILQFRAHTFSNVTSSPELIDLTILPRKFLRVAKK